MVDARSKNALAAAVQGAVRPNYGEVNIRSRGRLPHWEKDAGLYFVTFHLGDSLPPAVLRKMAERRRVLEAAKRAGRKLLPQEEAAFASVTAKKIEEYLDRGRGACWMKDARIAELVAESLRHWQGRRYRLLAWCVMPNHAHVVFRAFPGQRLEKLLHSWKGYTASTANEILGRQGTFWQHEYYDRLIRNGQELKRAIHYVCSNPERAGLRHWRWVWCAKPEDQ